MDPEACDGCPFLDHKMSDQAFGYITYAQYILEQLEDIELGFPPDPRDRLALRTVKREKGLIEKELHDQELEMLKERKKNVYRSRRHY